MQVKEKLEQARKLVQDTKKLMKRREQLLSVGSNVEEIDAEIKRNQAEYQDLYNCLTPLINLLFWDEQRAILNKFYLEAAPMSEIVSEVMKLPVDSSCLSFAQGRKQMAVRDLQKAVDRQEKK